MNRKMQQGWGISGFILGLLLATVIIGVLIFVLNRSRSSDFKDVEPVAEEVKVEILTPKQETVSNEPIVQTASEVIIEDVSTPPVATEVSPATQNNEVQQTQVERKDKATSKVENSQNDVKRVEKREDKPSPEQILESGSIEQARKDKQMKAEQKKAQSALNGEHNKQTVSGKAVVRVGSFSKRENAEEQRAKLAILGIHTQIVTTQVNNKAVYRVQTGVLNSKVAEQASKVLNQNGIDHFVSSAE